MAKRSDKARTRPATRKLEGSTQSIESLVVMPTKVKNDVQSKFLLGKGSKGRETDKKSGTLEQALQPAEQPMQFPLEKPEPFVLFEISYVKASPTKHKYEEVPVVKVYLDTELPFLHVRYGKALFDIRKVVYYNKRPAGWDYSWYDFITKSRKMGKQLAQVAYHVANGAWKKLTEGAAVSSRSTVYLYGWAKSGYSWTV